MALGPKEMNAAIARNLSEKTGKNLEQWLAVLEQYYAPTTPKKELLAYLKKEQGLGHFQAQVVYQAFAKTGTGYEDRVQLEKTLFSTKKQWELYQQLKAQVQQVGEAVQVQPCKTYIPFYHQRQFAVLRPAGQEGIYLGLSLAEHPILEGFEAADQHTTARITQEVLLQEAYFSPHLQAALQAAYQNS